VSGAKITVQPITGPDASQVSRFLQEHLNPSVSAERWAALVRPPWTTTGPNHGFQLLADDTLVGVYVAVYSERDVDGAVVRICNLAAFCVLEDYRMHGLRLVRALMKQDGYVFTDLSPSGNVVGMNERLGFRRLDTATKLVVNLPRWRTTGIRVSENPDALKAVMRGRDADAYRDHRTAAAARHLLVQRGNAYAYLMFRRDARKGLRLFASPLYVGGSRTLLEEAWSDVRSHLLVRHRLAFTLAERRILGFAPPGPMISLRSPRPKMFKGEGLSPAAVDYLYSELTLIEW
jgi:hypothetical protein